ncbi:hypothetical protein WJX74_009930 [Apatococcus lobatus]|uniref:Uncharacterized protein n=1 Tax=Apatococcus lobatus TaxID=904363 RepID=A0AAW1PQW3_9CHLO
MSGRRPKGREGSRTVSTNSRVVTERPRQAVTQQGKPLTLDARFTLLNQLRGQSSQRQTGAREAVLAKKRGQDASAKAAVKQVKQQAQKSPKGRGVAKRKGQKLRGSGPRPTSPAAQQLNKAKQKPRRGDQSAPVKGQPLRSGISGAAALAALEKANGQGSLQGPSGVFVSIDDKNLAPGLYCFIPAEPGTTTSGGAGPAEEDANEAALDLLLDNRSATTLSQLRSLGAINTQADFAIFAFRGKRQARLPLQLRHEIFAIFLDIFHGRPTSLSEMGSNIEIANGEVHVLDVTEMSLQPAEFEEGVVNLCQDAVEFYSTENIRLLGGLKENLVKVLGARLEPLTLKGKQGQGGIHLACLGENSQDLNNLLEVKNEMNATNSDPFFEAIFNYRRFLREHTEHTAGKRCSVFVTVVAGPWICVGAVCREAGLDFSPLTGFLPLMLLDDNSHRGALVRLLWALHQVTQLMLAQKPTPLIQEQLLLGTAALPYPLRGFKIVTKLSPMSLVYLVDLDGTAAVAKLCMQYGWAVHSSWADAGLAPHLLLEHCRELAGGWKLVFMDYLEPDLAGIQ